MYDFHSSYKGWIEANGDNFEHKLSGLDTATAEIFKRKYVNTILSQYKVGQMIAYFDWPGTQVFHSNGGFKTDMGSCDWVSGFVFR